MIYISKVDKSIGTKHVRLNVYAMFPVRPNPFLTISNSNNKNIFRLNQTNYGPIDLHAACVFSKIRNTWLLVLSALNWIFSGAECLWCSHWIQMPSQVKYGDCMRMHAFRLLSALSIFSVIKNSISRRASRARTSEQRVIVSIAYYFIIICVALNGSYLLVAKLLGDAIAL